MSNSELQTKTDEQAVDKNALVTRLQSLSPEEQAAAHSAWLDTTNPNRYTAKTSAAARAAESGNSELERVRVAEAHFEHEDAIDYASREAAGELTAREIATKEAFAIIFPDPVPPIAE